MSAPVTGATWDALNCVVRINGERVADGSEPTDTELMPTVLAGLKLDWGRSTTVDQPAVGTCRFVLTMPEPDTVFLTTIATGRPVTIEATGTAYTGVAATIADPFFTHFPLGLQVPPSAPAIGDPITVIPFNGDVTRNAGGLLLDNYSIRGHRPPPQIVRGTIDVTIPPADYVIGTPEAWDAIPQASVGQDWSMDALVTIGYGATATMAPVSLTKPQGTGKNPPTLAAMQRPLVQGANHYGFSPVVEDGTKAWIGARFRVTTPSYADIPAAQTYAATSADWTAESMAPLTVHSLQISGPADAVARTVRVFSGQITDATVGMVAGEVQIAVTAVDQLGQMAAEIIALEPQPVDPFQVRAAILVEAAGRSSWLSRLRIDPPYDNWIWVPDDPTGVGPIDIDRQSLLQCLQDLTAGHDLILWAATHVAETAPFLWIENPARRQPLRELYLGTGGLVQIRAVTDPGSVGGTRISACDVMEEPVRWVQDVAEVATRVAIEYQQMTGDRDLPTEVVSDLVVSDLDGTEAYGIRGVSVTSQSTSAATAQAVAEQILARLSGSGWRVGGLVWDLTHPSEVGPQAVSRALDLLDGTARIGRPIVLTDLPPWSPVPGDQGGYLEGGSYTYTGDGWVLDLTMSAGQGIGESARYSEIDSAWRYIDVSPDITYADLIGVGP